MSRQFLSRIGLILTGFYVAAAFGGGLAQAQDQSSDTLIPTPKPSSITQVPTPSLPTETVDALSKHAAICDGLRPKLDNWWYPSFDWSTPARYGHDRKLYRNDAGELVGNGIIDLPNRRDYVDNTVSYSNNPDDACPCEGDRCEPRFRINLKPDGGRRASYTRVASSLRMSRAKNKCPAIDFPDVPTPTYRWAVDGETIKTKSDNSASVCLTEGHHTVTMDVEYSASGETRSRSISRDIEVIDYLIVNLGDSYGAGEGVPEKSFWPEKMIERQSGKVEVVDRNKNFMQQRPFFDQWADPGTAIPLTVPKDANRLYAYSDMEKDDKTYRDMNVRTGRSKSKKLEVFEGVWDKWTYRSSLTGKEPDWEVIKTDHAGQYRMLMNHHAAHRSSAAAASQLALHLESHDDKSSVTFINLAASGATIRDGVLGRYAGVEELKSLRNPTRFRPRDRNGEIGLEPQVDELEYLLGSRHADSVYLSVGGNDVGFANIIAVFLTAFDGDSEHMDSVVGRMMNSFRDGQWSGDYLGGMAQTLGNAYGNFEPLTGLDNLTAAYLELAQSLAGLNINGDINLVGYPDFSSSTRQNTADFGDETYVADAALGTHYCNLKVKAESDPALIFDLDFDPIEFKVASEKIISELTRVMKESVTAINRKVPGPDWNYIDLGDEPRTHGICGRHPYFNRRYGVDNLEEAYTTRLTRPSASDQRADLLTSSFADRNGYRWYRHPRDGAAIQHGLPTSNKGMFHPNEFGYRHAARTMMHAVEPYGAEFFPPKSMPSLHRDETGADRFADPDDTIREARLTIGFKPGDGVGRLNSVDDVQIFKFMAPSNRCTPKRLRLTPTTPTSRPLNIRVLGINGEVLANSYSRDALAFFGPTDESLQARTETVDGLIKGNRLPDSVNDTIAEVMTDPDDTASDRYCDAADYDAIPASRQDKTGSEVSFLKEHRHAIYVAVSHADNPRFDPITGRGDVRDADPIKPVSFEIVAETVE
jgi:hypothetical protein